jgi:hypothetical protein
MATGSSYGEALKARAPAADAVAAAAASDAVAISDVRPLFEYFAALRSGTAGEMDARRFDALCAHMDWYDKMFRPRDADAAFRTYGKPKPGGGAAVVFYHQFRYKLLPEVAAKRHETIQHLVREMNRRGPPRASSPLRARHADPAAALAASTPAPADETL